MSELQSQLGHFKHSHLLILFIITTNLKCTVLTKVVSLCTCVIFLKGDTIMYEAEV
jgi:hypothetical protein